MSAEPLDHHEQLGRLAEELARVLETEEPLDLAALATRFEVSEAEVEAVRRALDCLRFSLGEEALEGPPELPLPTLPERYRIEGELGRGGMGVVYRVSQPELGRSVALKVLRPGDLRFGDALRRFRTEARSLARLRHRNIVSIHDVGETPEGFVWYAMDLIEGGTLADEIARKGSLTTSRAVRVMRQVSSAIAYAHGQGIVHRDLKPQNLLIDAAGDAFVADFGLARDAEANPQTLSGELLGTPAYMSPEQARGQHGRVGELTDVWALGALLYECLTGQGPFAGRPLHETIHAILHEDPRPPRKLEPRVPAELEAVCLKALAKRPADRYATALAFGEELESFAAGRGVSARLPSPLQRALRRMRRHSVALTTAAAMTATWLVLFFGFLLPGSTWRSRMDDAKRAVAAGYPGAALPPLRELARDLADGDPAWAELDLPLLQSLHAVVAEQLERGDLASAAPLFAEAAAIVQRRAAPGVDRPRAMTSESEAWDFELVVHAALGCAEPWPDPTLLERVDPDLGQLSADPFASALRSPSKGRRLAAFAAAFQRRARVELAAWSADAREEVLVALHRESGRRLASARNERSRFDELSHPPIEWSSSQLAAWWSPAGEDRLAALALDPAETVEVRALALHTWSIWVGLPVDLQCFFGSHDPLRTEASRECRARRAAAAPRLIAEAQRWRELPRAEALAARFALLAEGLADGAVFGFAEIAFEGTGTRGRAWRGDTAEVARAWLGSGSRRQTTEKIEEELREIRAGSVEGWARRKLSIGTQMPLVLNDTLDYAATAKRDESFLWRHLAWLRAPRDARVPTWVRSASGVDTAWLPLWWNAKDAPKSSGFLATLGVFLLEDASIEPRLLGEHRQPLRVGETIELRWEGDLGLHFEPRSRLRLFGHAAAEARHQRELGGPGARIGSVLARVRGRLSADGEGPRFEVLKEELQVQLSEIYGLRGCSSTGSDVSPGTAMIGEIHYFLGSALPSTLELALALRLDPADAEPKAADMDAWHSGFERRIAAKAHHPRLALFDIGAENLWPFPNARADLELLATRDPGRYAIGAQLAGASPSTAPTRRYDFLDAIWNARVAMHAPTEAARRSALRSFAEHDLRQLDLSPRLAAAVLQSAAAHAVDLPREQAEQLRSCADSSLPRWLTPLVALHFLLLLLVAGALPCSFLCARHAPWIAWVGWSAASLATQMHFTGFGIDGPRPALLFAMAALFGWRVAASSTARTCAIATPLLFALLIELSSRGDTTTLPSAAVLMLFLPPLVALLTRDRSNRVRRAA
ncbi:MAG: serine/threonine protein kinase [Planctomycetes bacterium]|nr:serine/threonine protein kinase [Planctomycetota bacterium]